MAKIVHCADIHFDTPFSARFSKDEAAMERLRIRDVFSKIIEEAKSADVLLIAGDLFDGEAVSEDTVRFIIRKFAEIPNTEIFIAAGNHDPYPIYKKYEWGENVHVFATTHEYVDLEDINLRVGGVSFSEQYCDKPLLGKFEASDSMANILLIHGETESPKSRYNPISKRDIEKSGADYAALGHIHKFSGIKKAGVTAYAYCGSPQGRGFDETGAHGIIVGEIGRGGVKLEFKPICLSRFEILNVDLSGAGDFEEIYERVLHAADGLDPLNDRIRIILGGKLSAETPLHSALLSKRLSAVFGYVELYDKTELDIDYAELAKENGMRGIFVRNMLTKTDAAKGAEKEKYELALKYGVLAMNGEDVEVC